MQAWCCRQCEEIKDTKKRRRTSPQELATLESNFQSNPLPDLHSRQLLAKKLGMTPRAVQIWFQVSVSAARKSGGLTAHLASL